MQEVFLNWGTNFALKRKFVPQCKCYLGFYCFPTAFFHKGSNNGYIFAFIVFYKQFFKLRYFVSR